MNCVAVFVFIASLAACSADVSHLSLSRSYLPPLSVASGYAYSSYPSYSGSAYSGSNYYSGSGGVGSGYGAPLATSGYNSYAYNNGYNNYATPSRAYLPVATNYGYNGLDTKYAANGGYIY
ncbi:heterogeneous nuclear ribonucleoprotein A/B [Drosophila nasuta]|uniref:heterogeneous nuclear ribonucleoprotein A/B n=1 Tax=Drosophila nasuta TaxID=42062 RepID=UPI00295EE249|nr:heterogeneous nuclear ribonucleoprotein A/B [Drosophila nasuta]